MTRIEDRLRVALHLTAEEIPPDAPPLRLAALPWWRRRLSLVGPLAAGVLVVAAVIGSIFATIALQGTMAPAPGTAGDALPPYYVAIVAPSAYSEEYDITGVAAEVRATGTGQVLARFTPPRPYTTFVAVSAAADDRTFVLVAEGTVTPSLDRGPDRFFLLHIDGADHATMRPLPASFVPAGWYVKDLALSPDGSSLAADLGNDHAYPDSALYVFSLTTGTERRWSAKTCPLCQETASGLHFPENALSWTADGRYLAFLWDEPASAGEVRLLDTAAPGTGLLADSKRIAEWPGASKNSDLAWRGTIVTPDGQTVVIVEEVGMTRVRQRLVEVSIATGKLTTIDDLGFVGSGYQQILYTNASGSLLVVTHARPGRSVGILNHGHYTPIRWDPRTVIAAW